MKILKLGKRPSQTIITHNYFYDFIVHISILIHFVVRNINTIKRKLFLKYISRISSFNLPNKSFKELINPTFTFKGKKK